MEESVLIKIIESILGFEEASDALLELKQINPIKAEELAKDIVLNEKGDIFFQACAWNVFYGLNRKEALEYANDNLSKLEEYLFGTILDDVADDAGIYLEYPEIQDFVVKVKKHLQGKTLKIEHKGTQEKIDWFIESYGE